MKKTLLALFLLMSLFVYAQEPDVEITPGGYFDNVFDNYGNQYTLKDIMILRDNSSSDSRFIDTSCDSGMFRLHFTINSGMENPTDANHIARRAVVCQVFHDVSEFINSPLKTNGLNNRVEIWIRNFQDINAPTDVLAAATSFNIFPSSTPNNPTVILGGILDGEIWKTIHTGVDSYSNITSTPIVTAAGSSSFYHGMVAINFSNSWNLDLNNTSPIEHDLYTVVLHEVIHALGIQSLINENGIASIGMNEDQYFNRYDTFLVNSNNQSLVTTNNTCSMYDHLFTANLNDIHPDNPSSACDSEITQCANVVNFNGTNSSNLPVFTPECFVNSSSLSHFEDSCVSGQTNNQYFVMSNVIATGVVKRFPKEEEKQALCDIGYELNSSFGSAVANNSHSYISSGCNGLTVAGVNDGVDNVTFNYIYNGAINTDININITGNSIFDNDINATSFEGLMDVYDVTAQINGSTTPLSGTIGTDAINFRTSIAGLHLLRYIPWNITTGQRGNITYIYINVSNNCGSPSVCNLVINGDFEQKTTNPDNLSQLNRACNWRNVFQTPDYFNTSWGIPCNFMGTQNVSNFINNYPTGTSHVGIRVGNLGGNEVFGGRLKNILNQNTDYSLSIDISQAERGHMNNGHIQVLLTNVDQVDINTIASGLLIDIDLNNVDINNWVNFTQTFNTENRNGLEFIFIGNLLNSLIISNNSTPTLFCSNTSPSTTNATYYYVDNISLISLDNSLLTLPEQVCINQTLDLTNFLNPAPAGGTFSGNGVTENVFTASTLGNQTITYTYTTANGCFREITDTIEVIPGNDAGILSGNQTINIGQTTTISSTVSGGTWSSSDAAIATVDANGLVTGISAGTVTVSYSVQSSSSCPADVKTIEITAQNDNPDCTSTTIWNGTSWSNGVPNNSSFLTTTVIFQANFDSTEDLFACSVLVTSNAIVTFKHFIDPINQDPDEFNFGHTLTVANQVTVNNGATLIFDDDASLVQINNSINSGNIEYRRRTPLITKFDYTYWSTPVANQTLYNLSPYTLEDKYYKFDPTVPNWIYTPSSTVMELGKGYIIRGDNNFSFMQHFETSFIGVPNNGTITTPVYNAASNSNLIGNPYPSAIDINCFLADPINSNLNGTIYLWAHNIPIDFTGGTQQNQIGSAVYNYNINSYAAYNLLGGVGTGITNISGNEVSTDRPTGKVAAGQSFFIECFNTGVATLKNSMRVGSQNDRNGQFFRSIPSETTNCLNGDRHRLWLQIRNLYTSSSWAPLFKQTLVGYSTLATTSASLDRDYDGKSLVLQPININLYSLTTGNTQPLTIQGRHLDTTFNTNDVIPLGFTCKLAPGTTSNTIEIATSEFDGLFDNTSFYLRENLGSDVIYHNIKTTPYTFTINNDIVDDTTRFAIVFDNPPLTQIQTSQCGVTLTTLNQNVYANLVSGAQQYKWRVTRQSDGQMAYLVNYLRQFNILNPNLPSGYALYNETYCIEVSVKINNVWQPYGQTCCVTTPSPTIQLSNCSNYTLSNFNNQIYCSLISPANGYHWKVENMSSHVILEFNTVNNLFQFSNTSISWPTDFKTYNTQYCIRVRPKNLNGQDNLSYGGTCCIWSPSAPRIANTTISKEFAVQVYPNPSNEYFKISVDSPNKEKINIKVYDMLGNIIDNINLNYFDIENFNFGKLYSTGIYNVLIQQENNYSNLRIIKN